MLDRYFADFPEDRLVSDGPVKWIRVTVAGVGHRRRPIIPSVRYACPCCGYPTLEEPEGYEICRLCNWEDDGQDDYDADRVRGGPNHSYSLSEARANFPVYLSMYSPDRDPRIAPDTDKAREAKKALVAVFDRIRAEASPARLGQLWDQVIRFEEVLRDELFRKVREYEERHRSKDSPSPPVEGGPGGEV